MELLLDNDFSGAEPQKEFSFILSGLHGKRLVSLWLISTWAGALEIYEEYAFAAVPSEGDWYEFMRPGQGVLSGTSGRSDVFEVAIPVGALSARYTVRADKPFILTARAAKL